MQKGSFVQDTETGNKYVVERVGSRNLSVYGKDGTVRTADCTEEILCRSSIGSNVYFTKLSAVVNGATSGSKVKVKIIECKVLKEDFEFVAEFNNTSDLYISLAMAVSKKIEEELSDNVIREKGKQPLDINHRSDIEFSVIEIDETASVDEQYMQIVGAITGMTKEINDSAELADTKDLEALFEKAKSALDGYGKIKQKETSGWFNKLTKAKDKKEAELSSVSSHIDYLFGIINDKFDKLVKTGEKFQKLKVEMTSQVDALGKVLDKSNEEMEEYTRNGQMVPMRLISINSQIAASFEAYKAKLLNIEAGITMTTGAVIALGAKLPAMRAGINDEMAFASLLADVGNVHGMITEAADLMLGIADNTSTNIYNKVEEILTSQINDDTMLKYLASRQDNTEKIAIMVSGKAQELADKLLLESNTIKQIASESSAESSTRKLKLLNAK